MQDLTQGPLLRHLLNMAGFIAAGLVIQAAYFVVDLYFVAGLGPAAIAGVSATGNFSFATLAGGQLIGVGALALIAQATGRRDQADANRTFNQAILLAAVGAAVTLAFYPLAGTIARAVCADATAAAYGRAYLLAFLPSLALTFPAAAVGSAFRGTGVVRPTMLIGSASVLLNAILAPVLITGAHILPPLGVVGAGLASSIANVANLAALAIVLARVQRYLTLSPQLLKPRPRLWLRIATIGAPAAGEFLVMFTIMAIVYVAIRGFGAHAQAGFGIGARIMQSLFLPSLAVSFAASPIAGQNYGAGRMDRVRRTFWLAAGLVSAIMLGLTAIAQARPDWLVRIFTADAPAIGVADTYLRIMSLNFLASGIIFVCSGMFQALGNTWPSFLSSASRLVTYGLPVIWLQSRPGITLDMFWRLSVASTLLQLLLSLTLLRRALRAPRLDSARRLVDEAADVCPPSPSSTSTRPGSSPSSPPSNAAKSRSSPSISPTSG